MRRKKRVRMHMIDPNLPSIEGLLMSSRPREYILALAAPLLAPGAEVRPFADAHRVEIPRERVAFYEVLR